MRISSNIVNIAALVALCAFGLAAVLFVSEGSESMQRLAILFGLFGLVVPVIATGLKATEAAVNTNGKLDARIEAAVHRANAARRAGDEPMTALEIDELSPEAIDRRLGTG